MHITEIVKQEQTHDEAIAVTVRCCSNPKTDSTVTIYGVHQLSAEQLQEHVDRHQRQVATKCHGMAAGQSLLSSLSKKPTIHEVL